MRWFFVGVCVFFVVPAHASQPHGVPTCLPEKYTCVFLCVCVFVCVCVYEWNDFFERRVFRVKKWFTLTQNKKTKPHVHAHTQQRAFASQSPPLGFLLRLSLRLGARAIAQKHSARCEKRREKRRTHTHTHERRERNEKRLLTHGGGGGGNIMRRRRRRWFSLFPSFFLFSVCVVV